MWKTFVLYIKYLGILGWILMGLDLFTALGAFEFYSKIPVLQSFPIWGWLLLLIIGLLFAPFFAFHKLRKEKDVIEKRIKEIKGYDIETVIADLLSVGIYSDMPINITRILYHDREQLAVGLSNDSGGVTTMTNLVLQQLNIRKIVQLEQRKERIYGSDNVQDKGYWILTELGKNVILYLQNNQQILKKEGSLGK
jgi:uncharacterized Tic20 family protein